MTYAEPGIDIISAMASIRDQINSAHAKADKAVEIVSSMSISDVRQIRQMSKEAAEMATQAAREYLAVHERADALVQAMKVRA